MRYSQEEMKTAYNNVMKKCKPMGAIFGALVGTIPALAIYISFVFMNVNGPIWILCIFPPAVIGMFSRFVGRTFRPEHRIPTGLIGAITHILGCYILGSGIIFYLLAPINFAIAMIVAKTKLSEVEEWAIYQADIGKLS